MDWNHYMIIGASTPARSDLNSSCQNSSPSYYPTPLLSRRCKCQATMLIPSDCTMLKPFQKFTYVCLSWQEGTGKTCLIVAWSGIHAPTLCFERYVLPLPSTKVHKFTAKKQHEQKLQTVAIESACDLAWRCLKSLDASWNSWQTGTSQTNIYIRQVYS